MNRSGWRRPILWIAAAYALASPAPALHAVSTASPLTVPPAAFVPLRPGQEFNHIPDQGSLFAPDAALFVAPVHLPEGVQVTAVVAFFIDASAATSRVILQRRRISTNESLAAQEVGLVDSFGSGSGVQTRRDDNILNPIVENTQYVYFLYVSLALDHSLRGVQIEFTGPPLLVDGFEAGNTSAWSAKWP